ncbi:hypothetical protein JQ543_05060 [Bradyrhizobium diazoefficiens]|nr:hypothetical protein [Bradyrhizobium diazoefficiens]MBR0847110.1 hypothetical protein [Bradyrhizobium diazoefficiens]
MIIEALIAGPDIILSGHTLHPDLIDAKLPVPLLREHRGEPVGEVYHLQLTSSGLVALAECNVPCAAYTHVSPSLRLMPAARMKLLEVSLVREPKSPHTIILARRAGDPAREYARCIAESYDLMIKRLSVLQQLVRSIHD